MTVREIRKALFAINSVEADNLRKELFDVVEQDQPASDEIVKKFHLVKMLAS